MYCIQVGISIYGQSLYQIQKCINSCIEQADCLITVRIDGLNACKDDVLEYLESICIAHKNIHLIHGELRLGSYGSLNRIFETSNTPYICQLDADDMLAPKALSLCTNFLKNNVNISFLYTDCLEIDSNGTPLGLGNRSLVEFTDMKSLIQFITFHLRVIRRSSFEEVGGYDSKLQFTGDYDISLKLGEVGDVVYLNRPLYYYRVHDSNTSFANFDLLNSEVLSICESALSRRGLRSIFTLIQGKNGEMTISKR